AFDRYPHFFRRLKQVRPQAVAVSLAHWPGIATHIVRDADVSTLFPKDAQVADMALRVLCDRDPDLLFVHFDEVDGAGHKHGLPPPVREYTRAVEQTAGHVGGLLEAVRARKDYANEDWLVLVSTDHGGSEKGHGKDVPEHRTVFVIVSGPAAARGAIEPP